MRRKAIAAATLAVIITAGTASATGDAVSRYRKVGGNGPARIVIRCAGWAEDVASRLILKDYTGDRVVYRCLKGSEV